MNLMDLLVFFQFVEEQCNEFRLNMSHAIIYDFKVKEVLSNHLLLQPSILFFIKKKKKM